MGPAGRKDPGTGNSQIAVPGRAAKCPFPPLQPNSIPPCGGRREPPATCDPHPARRIPFRAGFIRSRGPHSSCKVLPKPPPMRDRRCNAWKAQKPEVSSVGNPFLPFPACLFGKARATPEKTVQAIRKKLSGPSGERLSEPSAKKTFRTLHRKAVRGHPETNGQRALPFHAPASPVFTSFPTLAITVWVRARMIELLT